MLSWLTAIVICRPDRGERQLCEGREYKDIDQTSHSLVTEQLPVARSLRQCVLKVLFNFTSVNNDQYNPLDIFSHSCSIIFDLSPYIQRKSTEYTVYSTSRSLSSGTTSDNFPPYFFLIIILIILYLFVLVICSG